MNQHERLNYVEFAAADLESTKAFFSEVFAWQFEDFGPEYTAFHNAGLKGGFYKAEKNANSEQGSALLVFYSESLEQTQEKIKKAGGTILQAIFSFPGGRRFHFSEPSGNELAVWSDK